MSATWTPRDLDIVETLTSRIRLLTLVLIKRIWWSGAASDRTVLDRLGILVHGRLIHRAVVNLRSFAVHKPIWAWRPGEREPDFERLSRRARERWPAVAEPTAVFWATKLAANLFGSTAGRLPDLDHRDHDVLLAQVYAWYRTERPDQAQRWLG